MIQENDSVAGFIGVLSGLIMNTYNFRIAVNYDDDDIITNFSLLIIANDGRFVAYEDLV